MQTPGDIARMLEDYKRMMQFVTPEEADGFDREFWGSISFRRSPYPAVAAIADRIRAQILAKAKNGSTSETSQKVPASSSKKS